MEIDTHIARGQATFGVQLLVCSVIIQGVFYVFEVYLINFLLSLY